MKYLKSAGILLLLAALFLSACSAGKAGRNNGSQNAVGAVIQSQIAAAEETADLPSEETADQKAAVKPAAADPDRPIDLDLTTLSSTMVYSEVFNMMTVPEDYVGKIVKMDGLMSVYQDPESGNYYFACIVQDATACCSSGIEFVLTADYKVPDDYPKEGSHVTVVGEFITYMEGDYRYCTLKDAKLL